MTKINSKNAERHILLDTTDLKERGVVVPITVAKEAVAMAEKEAEERHQYETRWRSVEEELPETNNFGNGISAEVLCYVPDVHKVLSYSKNKFYPNGAWFNLSEEMQQYPTHWKPIE